MRGTESLSASARIISTVTRYYVKVTWHTLPQDAVNFGRAKEAKTGKRGELGREQKLRPFFVGQERPRFSYKVFVPASVAKLNQTIGLATASRIDKRKRRTSRRFPTSAALDSILRRRLFHVRNDKHVNGFLPGFDAQAVFLYRFGQGRRRLG